MRELDRAAEVAANSKHINKSYYLGCVALRKDGVFVTSTNMTISEHQTPSAHAEARVLRKAGRGAVVWIARVRKDKCTWALAKPCKKCRALLINYEVEKVIYTIGPNEYGIWKPDDKE